MGLKEAKFLGITLLRCSTWLLDSCWGRGISAEGQDSGSLRILACGIASYTTWSRPKSMRRVLATEQEGLVFGLCDSDLSGDLAESKSRLDSWAISVFGGWASCLTTDMPETGVRLSGSGESCLLARQHWGPSLLPKHYSICVVRMLVESGGASLGMVHEGVPE